VHIEIMRTNKTSSALAMISIVTTITLLTAGSITTSALAAKKAPVPSAPKVQHPQAHLANSWVV
jgi:hypothetical protein